MTVTKRENFILPREARRGRQYEILLHNPKSGIAGAEVSAHELQRALDQQAIAAKVLSVPGELFEEAVRRLVMEGAERVLVAGGDGSVASAARLLTHTNIPLGILPIGGANNFAAALGLPLGDLNAAAQVLRAGVVRAVSLGEASNGHRFTETAGVGLFADALALYQGARQDRLKAMGVLCRLLTTFEAASLRLHLDGKVVCRRALLCTVANTYRMADLIPVAPDATLTDSCFDVVVISDLRLPEVLRYLRAVRRGEHKGLPKVRMYRAREVVIETRDGSPRHVYADDAVIGTTPATFRLLPAALRVIIPPSPFFP